MHENLPKASKLQAFLTVDLEDFRFIVRHTLGLSTGRAGPEIQRGLDIILETVERAQPGAKLTFFTTGQLAEDEPKLIRALADAGHEVACHTHLHRDLAGMSRPEFERDLVQATSTIVEATGRRCIGFRAPSFSVPTDRFWLFEVLAEQGYLYDSSVVLDGKRRREEPFDRIRLGRGELLEFPIRRFRFLPGPIVRGVGGTYFRVLPRSVVRCLLNEVSRLGFPPLLWLHSSDVYAEFSTHTFGEAMQCSLGELTRWPLRRLRQKIGSRHAAFKLGDILQTVSLRGTLGEVALSAFGLDEKQLIYSSC